MSIARVTSFEEFASDAANGGMVAVIRAIPADLLTPLAAYLKIAREARHSFLLESVEGGEHLARYSFLGADPQMVVIGKGRSSTIHRDGTVSRVERTAIEALREHFASRQLAARSAAPFVGGAVGYLGYGAAEWFDPAMKTLPTAGNDAVFMIFDTMLAFDHVRQQLEIRAVENIEKNASEAAVRSAYGAAVRRTEIVAAALHAPLDWPALETPRSGDHGFRSNFARTEFESVVQQTQELIAAGECYQAVMSQRFSRSTKADAVSIYRALRATNPSPYMYLLKCEDESLIGASPEMLVRCRGDQLEYRPIAGTRPRGSSPEDDRRLADELQADEKERAEHVMLVDLGRNDLGKVAKFGTVRPQKLMTVEKYSHVQHLVSELTATLRDDRDRFDALGACFPAGTVTGAPKIRAMQAISELENGPRGVYSGSVLYADYAGNLDSCIAIRTIELRDGVAHVQAGAGIVADSQASSEFEETVNKSRALQHAVALAEGGV